MPPITVNANDGSDGHAVHTNHTQSRRRWYKIWVNPTTSAQLLTQQVMKLELEIGTR